jgi:quercetin dioxygenase-like cupin family protein
MTSQTTIDLKIKHHFREDLYMKEMSLPARHWAHSHKHNFDHIAFVYKGRVKVVVNGKETMLDGPDAIQIRADAVHKITAVTDTIWFCLHETDETDPDKIDHTLVKEG